MKREPTLPINTVWPLVRTSGEYMSI